MSETNLFNTRMKKSTKPKNWSVPSNWKDSAVKNKQKLEIAWHTGLNPLCPRGDLGRQSVILFSFYLQWSGVDVLDFLVVDVYPHDHVYHRRAPLHKCLSQLEQGCGKHWGKRNAHPLPLLKKNVMQAIKQWYDSTDAILNLNYTIWKVELLIFVLSFSGIWSSFTGQWLWYQERIELQFGFQFYYRKSFRVSVKCQIYLLCDFSMVIF